MSIVLITGSAGLIGSEAARHFAKQGFEEVGIDNAMRREFFGDQASTKWQLQELQSSLGRRYIHHNEDIRDKSFIDHLFAKIGLQISLVILGRELNYSYHNENRAGDHIWYLSDVSHFQSHYPEWKLTYNVNDILKDIYDANRECWCEIATT